ncbi:MAG: hypothetical protein ACRBC3_14615 [Burkholderiaceae bacterium]
MNDKSESKPLSKYRWVLREIPSFTNILFFLVGFANLIIGTISAFNGSSAIAATSLTGGLILLFAATIDRFESLKGLGVEAKTRALDHKLAEADDALRNLREITEVTGAAVVDLHTKTGRITSGTEPRKAIEFTDRIRKMLLSQGSDERTIDKVLRPWAQTLCFDMAMKQILKLFKYLNGCKEGMQAERDLIPQPIKPDDNYFYNLTEKIDGINHLQQSLAVRVRQLELEDYPEKFEELFVDLSAGLVVDVPEIDFDVVETIRLEAARFFPGMRSLRDSKMLKERELWLAELGG